MTKIDSLKEIQIIKQNDRQKVSLVEDSDGKKYIKRELAGDKTEVYKSLQKINHPNIPRIYHVELNDNTTVIEQHISAQTLHDFMKSKSKLGKRKIISVSNQILSALHILHLQKIIHRDIKPDNILIDSSCHIWLTDFDISRIYREDIRKDTETMGTFGYAPIEQFGMLPTDFKTDIYSFGVTLKTLLNYTGTKGSLMRIAEKCKRLDPDQRYKSANHVKRALSLVYVKPALGLMLFITALFITSVFYLNQIINQPVNNIPNEVSVQKTINSSSDTSVQKPDSANNSDAIQSYQKPDTQKPIDKQTNSSAKETEKQPPQNQKEISDNTPGLQENDFEGSFSGFKQGSNEAIYSKLNFYSSICIFSTQSPWEHIIFADDINKKGKIKLGKNNTVIDADITLDSGVLSVKLNDNKGNGFSHSFQYSGQYAYQKHYTDDIRQNADLICYDFNDDGGDELLIGLGESSTGVLGKQFYNNFNYCIAWCITYDETSGFALCEGDMFSKEYAFWISNTAKKLNITWEDIGDTSGYILKGNKITPVF